MEMSEELRSELLQTAMLILSNGQEVRDQIRACEFKLAELALHGLETQVEMLRAQFDDEVDRRDEEQARAEEAAWAVATVDEDPA